MFQKGLEYLKSLKKYPPVTNLMLMTEYASISFKQGIISFYRIINGKKEMKLWIALKNRSRISR